jgi:tetratricopeptide (TPR) repeat protein
VPSHLTTCDDAVLEECGDAAREEIDAHASTLMKRGLALVRENRPDAAAEALSCFDRARDLRTRLPHRGVPRFAYGLAACWLNRAEALLLLNDAARASDVVCAFDEAIALLERLPLRDDPRFPRRLALAHQNRALVLQASGHPGVAISGYTRAVVILEDEACAGLADRDRLLAIVWMNLSTLHAAEDTGRGDALASAAARRALALVVDAEASDADAAEAGLKARHVLCRISGRRLSRHGAGVPVRADDVHHATDLADDALDLVDRWERQGVARFRDVAADLFRFGALAYRLYQPQFLSEFVAERLDPARSTPDYVGSAAMQAAAREVLPWLDDDGRAGRDVPSSRP